MAQSLIKGTLFGSILQAEACQIPSFQDGAQVWQYFNQDSWNSNKGGLDQDSHHDGWDWDTIQDGQDSHQNGQ